MASIYHHQDSKAIQKELLEWIADPKSRGGDSLSFWANASLLDEAAFALAKSHLRDTVKSIEFHEIYVSTEALKALLTMPALEQLRIYGGASSDWAGPEYVWPTLETAHLKLLCQDPNARRLKTIILDKQQLSEVTGHALRAALPDLATLTVEGESF